MTNKDKWQLGLLLFFVFVTVCAMNDPYFLKGWIILLLLWFYGNKGIFHLSWIDMGVVVLWGYDLISLFTTINGNVSFLTIIPITLSVFYYFVLRIGFQNQIKLKKLFYFLSLFVGILSWFGVVAFGLFASSIREVGWQNLYDFRFLYRPLGNIANVWGTLLIVFFITVYITLILYRKQKKSIIILWGCLFPIIFGLITMFSRGIYVAFFMLLVLSISIKLRAKVKVRKKIAMLIGLCCCTLFPIFFYPQEVVRTLKMTETISQQRSIEGRIGRSLAIENIIKETPLTGAGIGNYTLIANTEHYENDLISYTNYAPNIFVQLLAEKGIMGFVLWGMFALLLIYFIFKHRRNRWVLFLGGCFFVLLIREATFPVFLDTPSVMIFGLTFLAFGQNIIRQKRYIWKLSPTICRYILIGCVLLFGSLLVNLTIYYKDEKYNAAFLEAIENKEYSKALEIIEKTTNKTPYLINRSLVYSMLENWEKAKEYIILAIKKNPRDIQLLYNLAIIYKQSGKMNLSQSILEHLTKTYPNNFLYQWGMFNCNYTQGKKIEAIPYLVRAIKLHPQMMDSDYWKNLLKQDQQIIFAVQIQLKECVNKATNEPIMLANHAKIALALQDTIQAEKLYHKVTNILPNLIYPWYYLGVIEWNRGNIDGATKYFKYFMRLTYGPFFPSEKMDEYIASGKVIKQMNNRSLFSTKYLYKFIIWYRSNTIEFPMLYN